MAENNVSTTESVQDNPETTSTNEASTNSDATENANQSAQNDSQSNNVNLEDIIQRAVDRATNKLGNENKKLRGQLETLKKDHMTQAQITELELAEREADVADREAKLQEKENRLFAIKEIKDAGLDDGSSNALELVDFVMSDSEETTKARVKVFADLVKKFVTAQVNQTFKSNGRNPESGATGESNATHTLVSALGKNAAERNAQSQNVLKHYLGGK